MQSNFWLTEKQLDQIKPFFPKPHGVPRVDDCRVISGIIHVVRTGMRWCDAPQIYGPYKTLYNRFVRWSRAGIFERLFDSIAGQSRSTETVMIDATHLKAHRTAASLSNGMSGERLIGRTKGGLNSKLHVLSDAKGRPIKLLLTEGQVSDYKGAEAMLGDLPQAKLLIADKGYDSNWFRDALRLLGIRACIPSRSNRKRIIPHNLKLYKERNKVERIFNKLKDWRRVATRYDRCAHTFFSTTALAAKVIFWL